MNFRVAAAQISHETNVFSAVATDLDAFAASGIWRGEQIEREEFGTNSTFGGFISGAARCGFELVPLLSVWATPSGIVTGDAISTLIEELYAGLRAASPLNGVLLGLHGAMVTEFDRDGDAMILEAVREVVGNEIPIVATFDLHANISYRMFECVDVLIGYDTYPHVDIADRAEEACSVLDRLMRNEIKPAGALLKPPMLPTSQRMTTDRAPMRELFALAHRFEEDRSVLAVSIAGGFPPSDVEEAGLSVLAYTDSLPEMALEIAETIANRAWDLREHFLGGVASFADAAEALAVHQPGGTPLVIVDIADNPWTGAPGDSAELLRFLLEQEVQNAALAIIVDPEAVRSAFASGPGKTVSVVLGGKTDALHGPPLPVEAYVRLLSDGCYVNRGPMMAGVPVNLGPTAVLVVAGIEVLVTSRAETPIDLNVFRVHGIEPERKSVIALKGKGHFRAAFEPISAEVILVEGPGITGADLARLPFAHLTRPIWPLDAGVCWRA